MAVTERRLADFGALFATAIADAHAREQVMALAEEQAALRRVATLAARALAPVEVLVAVTEEAARALETEAAGMLRFERDGSATLVAQSQAPSDPPPLGARFTLDGENIVASVHRTRQASRIDDSANATGAVAAMAPVLGRALSGRHSDRRRRAALGAMIAATARARLCRQHRVATRGVRRARRNGDHERRVARGAGRSRRGAGGAAEGRRAHCPAAVSDEVFTAVTESSPRCWALISRRSHVFTRDGPRRPSRARRHRTPWFLSERSSTRRRQRRRRIFVRCSRAHQRLRRRRRGHGGRGAELRLRSTVGAPIVVQGRLWGALMAATRGEEPLPQTRTRSPRHRARGDGDRERREPVRAGGLAQAHRRGLGRRPSPIEHDLHNGIQQQLVFLGMELGELEASLPADGELKPQVQGSPVGWRCAIDDLRGISRGIHPAILSHGGLGPALKTLARRSSVPVQLNSNIDGRLPERVEVAAYYVVSEALTNVARHAQASVVDVDVLERNRTLELSIRDDGVGGADPGVGTGLIGLKDRVEALDGEISVESWAWPGDVARRHLPLAAGPV